MAKTNVPKFLFHPVVYTANQSFFDFGWWQVLQNNNFLLKAVLVYSFIHSSLASYSHTAILLFFIRPYCCRTKKIVVLELFKASNKSSVIIRALNFMKSISFLADYTRQVMH